MSCLKPRTTLAGTPVVMIHGMWSRPAVFERFAASFRARGMTVFTPALPGHEEDSAAAVGNLGLADYLAGLQACLETIGQPAVLVGHSMGGLLAQQLAERCLARAVISLAPAPPAGLTWGNPGALRVFRRSVARRRFWRRPFTLTRREADYGLFHLLPPDQAAEQFEALVPESGRALFEIAFWPLDRRRAAAVRPAAVRCPMLFVAGAQDRLVSATVCRRAARRYGDRAIYVELSGHGHWLHAEPGCGEVAQLCLDWTSKALARSLQHA